MAIPFQLWSQQKVELGAFGGFANYQGDLVEDPIDVSETKLSYGVFLRYNFSDKLKLRGNFMYGYISGSDNNASEAFKERGWSFNSKILEATAVAEYHPFGKSRTGETGLFARQVSPYVGLGLGMVTFNPNVVVTKTSDAGLFPEQGEKTVSASIPTIVGVRADLFEFFSLGLEVGWRFTFNDYLDGVSQNGNPDRNDLYVLAGLTASFHFGHIEPDFNFDKE